MKVPSNIGVTYTPSEFRNYCITYDDKVMYINQPSFIDLILFKYRDYKGSLEDIKTFKYSVSMSKLNMGDIFMSNGSLCMVTNIGDSLVDYTSLLSGISYTIGINHDVYKVIKGLL